jgi:hypothetical protein
MLLLAPPTTAFSSLALLRGRRAERLPTPPPLRIIWCGQECGPWLKTEAKRAGQGRIHEASLLMKSVLSFGILCFGDGAMVDGWLEGLHVSTWVCKQAEEIVFRDF